MFLDRFREICGSAIVEEKQSLTETPQRGSPEFISFGLTLRNSVFQVVSHAMNGQVGKKINGLSGQRGDARMWIRGERWRVTEIASNLRK